jgi:hypothetical protein
VKEHFCHAADGYKFEGDYEAFMQELEQWSLVEVESITSTSTSTNTIRDYQWLQFDVLEYIKVLALNTSRNSGEIENVAKLSQRVLHTLSPSENALPLSWRKSKSRIFMVRCGEGRC